MWEGACLPFLPGVGTGPSLGTLGLQGEGLSADWTPPAHSDDAGPHSGRNCGAPGFHGCLVPTLRPQTIGGTCAPDLARSDPTLLLSPVAQYSSLLSTPTLPLSPVSQYSHSPQYPTLHSPQYPHSPPLPSTPTLPLSPVPPPSHSPQYPNPPTLPSTPTLPLSPVPQCIKRRHSHSDRSQPTGILAGRPTHHHLCAGPGLGDVTPEHQVLTRRHSWMCLDCSTMQEDPEALLALQRANIVAQYHQAHQAGSPQDLSLCKVTDHQGFLQDKELPGPSPREAKKLRQETRRVDKWIKMLKRWDHYLPSEKLRRQIYKGVPPQVRGQVWLRLLNIDQVKARNAGKYQEMGGSPGLLPGHHADRPGRQPHVPQSHHVLGPLRGRAATLFHMLAAYSVYDTEVGYCQGMSEIAAILMFLPEEDAFWALAQLMTNDRHAMHGFFVPGSPKLLRFQAHHERILQRALPDLRKHMDEEQMSTGIYTPKWFLQARPDPGALRLRLAAQPVLEKPRGSLDEVPGGRPSLPQLPQGRLGQPGVWTGPRPIGRPAWGPLEAWCQVGAESVPPGVREVLAGIPFSLILKLWDAYILDGEQVLMVMAYTILKVHRKRLLKLPLEGLREFLQDSLAQPWALEDEAVLRHLRASMTQLRRMRCDLPPQAGPEEFPTRPLGLERVSLAPGSLLPSPASETLPRVEEPASPGPATQPEPPGTPPGQAIVQHPPQRWSSLPTLPVQQDGAGRRPPDMGLRTKNGVPFPSAPA
ncbi:LOW QUALITY PROTEIN: TBC1 domain family member 3K-like [Canis aureus]